MLKNKHLARGIKSASILSRLNDMIDNINKKEPSEAQSEAAAQSEAEAQSEAAARNDKVIVPNSNKNLQFVNANPIVICVYQIRYDGLYPYIVYLLQKNKVDNTMNFISFPSFDGGKSNKRIKPNCIAYVNRNFPNLSELTYEGFFETAEKNVVILKNTSNDSIIPIDRANDSIWTTAHEIINLRKVLNFSIHKNVIELYEKNTEFLYVKNINNINYETPMIGYYSSNENDYEKIDIYREVIIPALGKCYYLYLNIPAANVMEANAQTIIRTLFFAGKLSIYINNKTKNTDTDAMLCSVANTQRIILNNYNQQTSLSLFTFPE